MVIYFYRKTLLSPHFSLIALNQGYICSLAVFFCIVSGQASHDYTAAITQLKSASSRLHTATESEGDPDVLELGTRALKELSDQWQNTSSKGGSRLISPPGFNAQLPPASPANQMPPALIVDNWQTRPDGGRQQPAQNFGPYQPAPAMANVGYSFSLVSALLGFQQQYHQSDLLVNIFIFG